MTKGRSWQELIKQRMKCIATRIYHRIKIFANDRICWSAPNQYKDWNKEEEVNP